MKKKKYMRENFLKLKEKIKPYQSIDPYVQLLTWIPNQDLILAVEY